MTAELQSPHTVQLFDFGVTETGSFYYVMERLRGLNLQHMVERFGPLPAERTVFLLKQACLSLSEAQLVLECLAKAPGDCPANAEKLWERLEKVPLARPWHAAACSRVVGATRPFSGIHLYSAYSTLLGKRLGVGSKAEAGESEQVVAHFERLTSLPIASSFCRSRSCPRFSGPVLPSASGESVWGSAVAGCSPGSRSTSVFAAQWYARRRRASPGLAPTKG